MTITDSKYVPFKVHIKISDEDGTWLEVIPTKDALRELVLVKLN